MGILLTKVGNKGEKVWKWGIFRENVCHFKHVKFEVLEGYLNDYIKEKVTFRKG